MNIGIVTTWFERGAAYVSRAYAEILSREHHVYIYARGGETFGKGDPNWDKPNVRWTTNASVIIDKDDFENWIQQYQIELIIFNEQEHWWYPILWAHDAGVKTVAYIDYYRKRMIPWFSSYDALWCNTQRHYSVFKDHPGSLFIPWGTDLDLYKPKSHEPNRNLVFFHSAGMGGINLRKGTDILVKSFVNVKGSAELIIHSQVPLSNYGEEISNLINNDHRIKFIEQTVPAPGLYHLGDIYVYPNRLDGIGLSVTEALACGLPVICTDAAPCNEIVIPGISGWRVPAKSTRYRKDNYYWPETECDGEALTGQMQQCVNNRNNLKMWQIRARNFAENHLDWEKNSSPILSAVNQIRQTPTKKISRTLSWDIKNYYASSPSLVWKMYWRVFYPYAR